MNDMMNKKRKYNKILNTEHKFETLYGFNSAQIFLSSIPYDFLLTVIKSKTKFFFYYSAPLFYRVQIIPNSEISGTYRVLDGYPVHPYHSHHCLNRTNYDH